MPGQVPQSYREQFGYDICAYKWVCVLRLAALSSSAYRQGAFAAERELCAIGTLNFRPNNRRSPRFPCGRNPGLHGG